MRHRLIPAALAASGAVLLLASTALAATPTWVTVPSVNPSATTNFLNAVAARTASDAWAVGQFQATGDDAGLQILAERWNGTSWQQVPTPNIVQQDERLLGVSASGPSDAWAVGNTNRISFASHDALAAHWDGTAWTIAATPAAENGGRLASLYDVADLSPANAWAVGQGKDARPLAEHWDGTTWSVVPVPVPTVPSGTGFANAVLSSISAVSPTDIWAVGTTTAIQGTSVVKFTLAEHYNGTAWSIVKTVNTTEPTGLTDVTAISANNAWAVGNGFNNVHDTSASAANKAVIEHWNGTSWSMVAAPSGLISIAAISAASATDIWAVGGRLDTSGTNPVVVTVGLHWNGTAWSVVASPTGSDPSTSVSGLSALPSGEVWAAGISNPPGTDNFNTFTAHHAP
jgi:hypothetical protein